MKKRIVAAFLAAMMVVSMAGCGSGSGETDKDSKETAKTEAEDGGDAGEEVTSPCGDPNHVWDPYTSFDETVTFTKGLTKSTGSENFPEGDDYTNNDYTRYVKERVNVQPEIAWEVDSNNYEQKVSLSISTGDIPDIMIVNRTIFKQLVENDLIWDMTEAFDKCISPELKEWYDSFADDEGNRLLRQVTVDGKLMGVPGCQLEGQHNLFWVRKDWMDKLGLEEPKTLDDIEAIARAFVEKDPGGNGAGKTVGFAASEEVYGGYNSQHGLYSVFNAYDAYPKQWIEKDGKVVYGSTQPEMKEALKKINSWYEEGLLDKEFAVRKGADREALIASGQCGIMFGPWWGWGGVPDAITNNPDAEWAVYSAPKDENGKIHYYAQDPLNGILVVSKKFEHPEAIVKALNAEYEVLKGLGEGREAYLASLEHSPNMGWGVVPLSLQVGPQDALRPGYEELMEMLETNNTENLEYQDNLRVYNVIMEEREHPKADVYNWQEAFIRQDGTREAIDTERIVKDVVFYGTTETMGLKKASLDKLEVETMVKIIMGEKPIDEFDNFVETWKKMGGDEITAEVQEEVDHMK